MIFKSSLILPSLLGNLEPCYSGCSSAPPGSVLPLPGGPLSCTHLVDSYVVHKTQLKCHLLSEAILGFHTPTKKIMTPLSVLSYPMLIYLTFKKWNLIIKATDDSLPFFSLSSVLFLAQCIFCIGRNFCTLVSLLYTFKKKKITFTTLLLIPQALRSIVPELAHRNFIQDSLPYLSRLIFGILIQPSQNNLVILY